MDILTKRCQLCGGPFSKKKNDSVKTWENKKYCTKKCANSTKRVNYDREKRRLMMIGNKYSVGRVLSGEHKEKIRRAISGKRRDNPFGEMAYNWRGGITPLIRSLRTCSNYINWRKNVFIRDKFRCVECGDGIGGNLNADHIIPFSYLVKILSIKSVVDGISKNDLWDIENGRTLCKSCHKKTKTWGSKSRLYAKTQFSHDC